MPDIHHKDKQDLLVYLIDNPAAPYSNPIKTFFALQPLAGYKQFEVKVRIPDFLPFSALKKGMKILPSSIFLPPTVTIQIQSKGLHFIPYLLNP
jgi:hypothetical protein